jgi:hypothetical protein
MKKCLMALSLSLLLVLSGLALAAPTWTFDSPDDIATWSAINQCNVSVENGVLKTESTGADPYFFPGGEWGVVDWEPFSGADHSIIYMRVMVNVESTWQVYYITEENTAWGEEQRQNFVISATGSLENVEFLMEDGGWQEHTVTNFRIDPGTEAGVIAEIDYISLESPAAPVKQQG